MQWMNFVKRRGSTPAKTNADIAKLRKSYLLKIKGMVDNYKISSELVINWDQAGVKLVPIHVSTHLQLVYQLFADLLVYHLLNFLLNLSLNGLLMLSSIGWNRSAGGLFYDHIWSIKNGFKKAGITEALEGGLPEAYPKLNLQDFRENDPFSSDSD